MKDIAVSLFDINSLYGLQDDKELEEIRDYQRKIDNIIFIMIYSYPDICFVIFKLNQYMNNFNIYHEIVIKYLLQYLRSTKNFQICYRIQSRSEQITEYINSDFAIDKNDRQSVSDFMFKFVDGSVSWTSRKQKSVTISTIEAELMILVSATKHIIGLSKFFTEIDRFKFVGPNSRTIIMNENNQATIKMINNNQITERSKHIDIDCHFIYKYFENQNIDIQYYHTNKMTADDYTKELSRDKFNIFI